MKYNIYDKNWLWSTPVFHHTSSWPHSPNGMLEFELYEKVRFFPSNIPVVAVILFYLLLDVVPLRMDVCLHENQCAVTSCHATENRLLPIAVSVFEIKINKWNGTPNFRWFWTIGANKWTEWDYAKLGFRVLIHVEK